MTSSAAGCTGERELKRIQKAKEDPTIEPQPVETPKQVVDARPRSHRRRALGFLLALALVLAGWWGSGYVFAYTDDAYITSDIVSVSPEVSGPIATVDVADNQWVARGTPLFTIDPIPFELEVQQARCMRRGDGGLVQLQRLVRLQHRGFGRPHFRRRLLRRGTRRVEGLL